MAFTETVISLTGVALGTLAGVVQRRYRQRAVERNWRARDAVAEQSLRLLRQTCAQRLQAMVVEVASGASCPVNFDQVVGPELTVKGIEPFAEPPAWPRHALVAIQFNLDDRARLFVSPLKEVCVASDDRLQFTTLLPKHIAHSEARAAFRVGVSRDADMRAQIEHEGGVLDVQVADASTIGMGFRCRDDDLTRIAVGAPVRVRVASRGRVIVRAGTTRRAEGGSLGVAFALDGTAPAEQAEYAAFVRSLVQQEAA